jgi:N-acetyl sugar amidotransferase
MNKEQPYKQCALSVMDTIADPDITFDEKGICNYYYDYQKGAEENVKKGEIGKQYLQKLVAKIKEEGKGKPYDCIMGLSGGVDSSYVAYLCKQHGLRPLAVHFDNGWNSELAVKNIESMVNKCGFDLYTLVVDWEEFKDIQLSYLKASVVDIEVPTDHAITAVLMKLALKHGIKYSISGINVNTEFILPKSWIFNKGDHINLQAIQKQYGTKKIKTFPLNDTILKKRYNWTGVQSVNILNYLDYNKQVAKNIITNELGWKDYGGKHYESLFTKFYQAYILPQKFRIDKRKPHLTNMIFSGEITKEQAEEELKKPLYTPAVFQQEKDFFLKKLCLSEIEWEIIMNTAPRSHYDFDTERPLDERYKILKPAKYLFSKIIKT